MILPSKYSPTLYKGATFKLQFRLRNSDGYFDISGYSFSFVASDEAGGDEIINKDSTNSPSDFSIDASDDNLVTVELSADETAAITAKGSLEYRLDVTTDTGEVQRRLVGNIKLVEDV